MMFIDDLRTVVTYDLPARSTSSVTNPDEVSAPGKVKPTQALGFAKAKVTEFFNDRGVTSGDEN